jgi:hypothetical protein
MTTDYSVYGYVTAAIAFVVIVYFYHSGEILKEGDSTTKYSFAKFQLALWMLVIAPLFCIYWGYHGKAALNETALVLLGISAATTVVSTLVKANLAADPANQGLLKMDTRPSKFWIDILSDDGGNLSIARLQNLIFTFIYIVIYVALFFGEGTGKDFPKFPDFDSTTYTLMGISSGSYVLARGMKK